MAKVRAMIGGLGGPNCHFGVDSLPELAQGLPSRPKLRRVRELADANRLPRRPDATVTATSPPGALRVPDCHRNVPATSPEEGLEGQDHGPSGPRDRCPRMRRMSSAAVVRGTISMLTSRAWLNEPASGWLNEPGSRRTPGIPDSHTALG